MVYSTRQVTKDFAGVTVLQDVSFACHEGQIHGLIGENGAGKSTLVKIMAGLLHPSSGQLLWDKEEVSFPTVHHATAKGVYLVPQEPSLLPDLTIAENLTIGRFPKHNIGALGLDWRGIKEAARESLEKLGFTIDVTLPAGGLSIAAQQLVECARALMFDSKYILFDEPTSPLDAAEVDMLSGKLRELRDSGHGIVLISHRLSEMFALCDDITVLRDGRTVGDSLRPPFRQDKIVKAMIGRELQAADTALKPGRDTAGETLLRVTSLASPPVVRDVNFEVRAGEVVGFAGLIGSGRTESAESVVGLRPKTDGVINMTGVAHSGTSASDAFRRGLVYVPEDRAKHGAFLDLSVKDNITVGVLHRLTSAKHAWMIPRLGERQAAKEGMSRTDVRCPSQESRLRSLSGGNQQKSLIARALLMKPRVLVLDEPTRGIDVGAKAMIHKITRDLANSGLGVVFISSELEELTHVSDRIVVFYEGRTVGVVERDSSNEWPLEQLGHLVIGGEGHTESKSYSAARPPDSVSEGAP
jgi:rhamnose transport system ATP-binding protein